MVLYVQLLYFQSVMEGIPVSLFMQLWTTNVTYLPNLFFKDHKALSACFVKAVTQQVTQRIEG